MENQVTVREIGTVAPADMFGGSTGFEGVDRECQAIPFLKIAQESTEQAKRASSTKIEGLQTGMFFCPSSRRIYGETFRGVVVKFYRNFSVYDGEGMDSKWLGTIPVAEFKGTVENAPGTKKIRSYFLDANGHRYVDNRNFVVIPYDTPDDGLMLLTLNSTNIKASKTLISLANNLHAKKMVNGVEVSVPAPIWSSVWDLTTIFREDPPYSYFSIGNVDRKGWVPVSSAPFLKDLFESLQDVKFEQSSEDDVPAEPVVAAAPETQAAFDKAFAGSAGTPAAQVF